MAIFEHLTFGSLGFFLQTLRLHGASACGCVLLKKFMKWRIDSSALRLRWAFSQALRLRLRAGPIRHLRYAQLLRAGSAAQGIKISFRSFTAGINVRSTSSRCSFAQGRLCSTSISLAGNSRTSTCFFNAAIYSFLLTKGEQITYK
jgi:hypothetical protein